MDTSPHFHRKFKTGCQSRIDAFPPTSLSEIIEARSGGTRAHSVRNTLCEKYWDPLYSFLRKRGHKPEDAQDITQGFFAKFLAGEGFAGFDPDRGRLRSYLLGGLTHYESNWRRHDKCPKRGGEYEFVSFDLMQAEASFEAASGAEETPDVLYDKRWAITLLSGAQRALREDYKSRGKERLFDALHIFMDDRLPGPSRAFAAEKLGMNLNAVKTAVSRMRKRRREILTDHIALTVASPDMIEDEIAYLISLFRSDPPVR